MKYEVVVTRQFRKDYKLAIKRGYAQEKLEHVIELLRHGEPLPERYRDHALVGNYAGFRECHIQPDWLLIYTIDNGALILTLSRTGSHSDLF